MMEVMKEARRLWRRDVATLLCFSLIPILFASVSVAAADNAVVWVNASDAPCSSQCGPLSAPCPNIRCALKQAEDNTTLRLLPGIYTGDNNVGISSANFTSHDGSLGADDYPGSLTTVSGLSLVGSGIESTVVSCEGSLFNFFLNTRGSFLSLVARLTVTNCRALSVLNATLHVSDAHFTNYTPPFRANGTGIFASGSQLKLSMHRVVLDRFSAQEGSALAVIGGLLLQVTDCNFTSNGWSGGAGTADVDRNVKTLNAGAVWLVSVDKASFEDCYFIENRAQQHGGAVVVDNSLYDVDSTLKGDRNVDGVIRVLFRRTVFSHNAIVPSKDCKDDATTTTSCSYYTASGGAVFVQGVPVAFDDCAFMHNKVESYRLAGGRGGALFASPTTDMYTLGGELESFTVQIWGTRMLNNLVKTVADASGPSQGGAIYATYVSLQVSDSVIQKNMVRYVMDSVSSARGSTVYSTTQLKGGAISCVAVDLMVVNSTFEENEVGLGGSGGAVWVDAAGRANFTYTLFLSNAVYSSYAKGSRGGAIMSQNGVALLLQHSMFQDNAASGCTTITEQIAPCMSGAGGAVAVLGSSLHAENVTFFGNTVQAGGLDEGSSGGAVSLTDTTEYVVVFLRCIFAVNAARGNAKGPLTTHGQSGRGGAVCVVSGSPVFKSSHFQLNWAEGAGQAPAFGGAVAVTFSTSSSSNADVDISSPVTYFDDCEFIANHACSLKCKISAKELSDAERAFGVVPLSYDIVLATSAGDVGSTGVYVLQSGHGGAIAVSTSNVIVERTRLLKNRAHSSLVSPGLGGALYLSYSGSLLVKNCTLFQNFITDDNTRNSSYIIGAHVAVITFFNKSVHAAITDGFIDSSCSRTARPTIADKISRETRCWELAVIGGDMTVSNVDGRENTFKENVNMLQVAAQGSANAMVPKSILDGVLVERGVLTFDTFLTSRMNVGITSIGGITRMVREGFGGSSDSEAGSKEPMPMSSSSNENEGVLNTLTLIDSIFETCCDVSIGSPTNNEAQFLAAQAKLRSFGTVSPDKDCELGEYESQREDDEGSETSSFCPKLSLYGDTRWGTVAVWAKLSALINSLQHAIESQGDDSDSEKYSIDDWIDTPRVPASSVFDKTILWLTRASISASIAANEKPVVISGLRVAMLNGLADEVRSGWSSIAVRLKERPYFQQEITSGTIILRNARFLLSGNSVVFIFSDHLSIVSFDNSSEVVLEGDVHLVDQSSVEDEVAALVNCGPSDGDEIAGYRNDDDIDSSDANVTVAPRLFLNCTARQTKQSQIYPETLQARERQDAMIRVRETIQWEGALNLTSALPALSVRYEPGKRVRSGDSWTKFRGASLLSRWDIIDFIDAPGSLNNNTGGPPKVQLFAPDGVGMFWNATKNNKNGFSYGGFANVNELGCGAALTYSKNPGINIATEHNGTGPVKDYTEEQVAMINCSICLLNRSCHYVQSSEGPDYGCREGGQGSSKTCCPKDCNQKQRIFGGTPAGQCIVREEWYLVHCRCEWYWKGEACDEVSTKGWILYLLSGSVLVVAFVSAAWRIIYKWALRGVREDHRRQLMAQEGNTLNRLREQLLGGYGGRTGGVDGSGPDEDYLRDIVPKLVLKDVMVPFESLQVETLIGEGGIGVVYKAKFRSAPVALKLIKTPEFMAMDDMELERFQAEAYLMSRLRHPNLVLIMGVTQYFEEKHSKRIPASAGGPMRGFEIGNKTIGIISEYLNRGSLADVLYGSGTDEAENLSAALIASFGSKDKPFHEDNDGSSGRGRNGSNDSARQLNIEEGSAGAENPLLQNHLNEQRNRTESSDSLAQFRENWNYDVVLSSALQAARGLLFLHSQMPPIVHRDVKCSNLVIDEYYVVKITDFGMSRLLPQQMEERTFTQSATSAYRLSAGAQSIATVDGFFGPSSMPEKITPNKTSSISTNGLLPSYVPPNADDESDDEAERTISGTSLPSQEGHRSSFFRRQVNSGALAMTSNVGTVAWMAPEINTGESPMASYSLAVDVYSFGMVLYELAEKRAPFSDETSRFDIMDKVSNGERPQIRSALLLTQQPGYRELMEKCWDQKPELRPSMAEVVETLEELYSEERRKTQAAREPRSTSRSASMVDNNRGGNTTQDPFSFYSAGTTGSEERTQTVIEGSGGGSHNYSALNTGEAGYSRARRLGARFRFLGGRSLASRFTGIGERSQVEQQANGDQKERAFGWARQSF